MLTLVLLLFRRLWEEGIQEGDVERYGSVMVTLNAAYDAYQDMVARAPPGACGRGRSRAAALHGWLLVIPSAPLRARAGEAGAGRQHLKARAPARTSRRAMDFRDHQGSGLDCGSGHRAAGRGLVAAPRGQSGAYR